MVKQNWKIFLIIKFQKNIKKNIIWSKYIKEATEHNDNLKNKEISIIKDKTKANEKKKEEEIPSLLNIVLMSI